MRIEEWRQFLESQFIEEGKEKPKPVESAPAKSEPEAKETPVQVAVSPPTIAEYLPKIPVKPAQSESAPATETAVSVPTPLSQSSQTPPKTDDPPQPERREPAFGRARSEESAPPADTPAPSRPAAERTVSSSGMVAISVPNFVEYVPLLRQEMGLEYEPNPVPSTAPLESEESPTPRLRRRKRPLGVEPEEVVPPEMEDVWASLPKHLRYLAEWYDDGVTQKYYKSEFKETREALIGRLTDPVLSLEDTARLLGVCPTTVRRYTDRGWLQHFRTEGNQRRFRLSDIVQFLEDQSKRKLGRSRKTADDSNELEEPSES